MPQPIHGPNYVSNRGFTLLLAVLVMGVVGGAIALYLLTAGTMSSQASEAVRRGAEARGMANACAETALGTLETCTPASSATITFDPLRYCTYQIAPQGQGQKITAQGIAATMLRKVEVFVTSVSPTIQIGSWQEVAP